MLGVAGVDAFRRITDFKFAAALQLRLAFQDRNTDFLGATGIDRRLIDDDGAACQVFSDQAARLDQRREIRPLRSVHRRRHRDDDQRGALELRRV